MAYLYNGMLFGHKRDWRTTRMSLENMLSERSQLQRPHVVWFYLYEMSKTGQSIETEGRLVVARGWGGGEGGMGVTANGLRVLFRMMEMFWN